MNVKMTPLPLQTPAFQEQKIIKNLYQNIKDVFQKQKDKIAKLTRNPGKYRNNKDLLEMFSLLAPRILRRKQDEPRDKKVSVSTKGFLQNLEHWLLIQAKQNFVFHIYFDKKISLNANIASVDPRQFYATYTAVKDFVQQQGIVPFLNFATTFAVNGIPITPVGLVSQLTFFMLEYKNSFSPSMYRRKASNNSQRLNFSVFQNKEGQFMLLDFANFSFPAFTGEEIKGTSMTVVQSRIQDLEDNQFMQNYVLLEDAEKQTIIQSNKMKSLSSQITGVMNRLKNQFTGQQDRKFQAQVSQGEMREQKTQKIPPVLLNETAKVETQTTKTNNKVDQITDKIIKLQLPTAIKALQKQLPQRLQVTQILETTRSYFLTQLKSLQPGKSVDLEQLNDLPKDVMLGIVEIQNQSKVQVQNLKLNMVKVIAQITKMKTVRVAKRDVQIYVTQKQTMIAEGILNYISQPIKQIEILKQKGIRLVQNSTTIQRTLQSTQQNTTAIQNLTNITSQKLDNLYGQYSNANRIVKQNFNQMQAVLIGLRDGISQNQMAFVGFSSSIENNLSRIMTSVEQRYSTNISLQIADYKSFLLKVQQKSSESFTLIIEDLNQIKLSMKDILNSLIDISKQIQKLNDQVQIVKQLNQKSLDRQVSIMNAMQEMVSTLIQKGFLEISAGKTQAFSEKALALEAKENQMKQKQLNLRKNIEKFADIEKILENNTTQKKQKIQLLSNDNLGLDNLEKKILQKKQKIQLLSNDNLGLDNLEKNLEDKQKRIDVFKGINQRMVNSLSSVMSEISKVEVTPQLKEKIGTIAQTFGSIKQIPRTENANQKINSMQSVIQRVNQIGNLQPVNQKISTFGDTIAKVNNLSLTESDKKVSSIQDLISKIKSLDPNQGVSVLNQKMSSIKDSTNRLANMNIGIETIQQKLQEIANKSRNISTLDVGMQGIVSKVNQLKDKGLQLSRLIEQDIVDIGRSNEKLVQVIKTIKNLSDQYSIDDANTALVKLKQIIDLLMNSTSQLIPYGEKAVQRSNNIFEALQQIKNMLQQAIGGFTADARRRREEDDEEKRKKDDQIAQLRIKFEKLSRKSSLLQLAYQGLADGVADIFQTQTKWMNEMLRSITKKGRFAGKQRLLQNIVGQLSSNYRMKLDSLLDFVKRGFPNPIPENLRNDEFVKEINQNFQKFKRVAPTQDFDWWKTSDKMIKL